MRASLDVIVDQPHRLHQGIQSGRAHEAEAKLLERLAQRERFSRLRKCTDRLCCHFRWPRLRTGLVRPYSAGKCTGAFFVDQCADALCIVDRAYNLSAMPNDAGIKYQTRNVVLSKSRNFRKVKASKHLAESFAFAQYRDPAEARLKSLKHDLLVQYPIVARRHAPFAVVVVNVVRKRRPFATPRTALVTIGVIEQCVRHRDGRICNSKMKGCGEERVFSKG
jgi:hypothetical protein